MKKLLYACVAVLLAGSAAIAQPVSDNAVIPVAVTLNQVLRLHVTKGGNIEFVFNSISQYKNGINSGATNDFYDSDFDVASSTDWQLVMGADETTAYFEPTDDPGNNAQLTLDNVGFQIEATGAKGFVTGEDNDPQNCSVALGNVVPLLQYSAGTAYITSAAAPAGNAGDVTDNSFIIHWRCGTQEGTMNGTSILDQSLNPDRYVTNVLLEISQN